MPKVSEYTAEFKDWAVRLVVAEQAPDVSRLASCERLGPRLGVKPITLYAWVKKGVPRPLAAASVVLRFDPGGDGLAEFLPDGRWCCDGVLLPWVGNGSSC